MTTSGPTRALTVKTLGPLNYSPQSQSNENFRKLTSTKNSLMNISGDAG
jgi:hypothetical protein